MKKSAVAFIATFLFIVSLQPAALAANVIQDGNKRTPYGTMEGVIATNGGNSDYTWFYAETSIDSRYTMAETIAKLDIRANDTGALLSGESSSTPDGNYAICYADGSNRYGKLALFSTHEVIYTSSYVLYLDATY
jgi:hypothetical protein